MADWTDCPDCEGVGSFPARYPYEPEACDTCEGTGRVPEDEDSDDEEATTDGPSGA